MLIAKLTFDDGETIVCEPPVKFSETVAEKGCPVMEASLLSDNEEVVYVGIDGSFRINGSPFFVNFSPSEEFDKKRIVMLKTYRSTANAKSKPLAESLAIEFAEKKTGRLLWVGCAYILKEKTVQMFQDWAE